MEEDWEMEMPTPLLREAGRRLVDRYFSLVALSGFAPFVLKGL
jgi:hypothetical protein